VSESACPVPRPEHPRPDAFRPDWVSLNGPWDFAFDPRNLGEQLRWYRPTRAGTPEDQFELSITVPFPWESKLSGVSSPEYRGAGWYRRRIEIPADWLQRGLRPILHFGAVDWSAKVWVNGWFASEHDAQGCGWRAAG
jgi:beta-galactosidase/beta-glucuronidase